MKKILLFISVLTFVSWNALAQCPPANVGLSTGSVANAYNDFATSDAAFPWGNAVEVGASCGYAGADCGADIPAADYIVQGDGVADGNDATETMCFEFPPASFDPAETGPQATYVGFDFSYNICSASGELVGILQSTAYQDVGGVCTALLPSTTNIYGHGEYNDNAGVPGTGVGAFDPTSSIWFCVEIGFTDGSVAESNTDFVYCGNAVTYGDGNSNQNCAACPAGETSMFAEDFEGGQPAGWTFGSGGDPWEFGNADNGFSADQLIGSGWMTIDDDANDNIGIANAETPCIDLSTLAAADIATLSFLYDYDGVSGPGESVTLTVTDGTNTYYYDGATSTWVTTPAFWLSGGVDADGTFSSALPSALNGQGCVQIEFIFDDGGTWSWGLGIDCVNLCASSAAVCDIETAVSNIVCDDNGTPADPSDDTFTFDVDVTQLDPAFTTFSSDAGDAGVAYGGGAITYGPYPISGGTVTVTYTDDTDPNCTETADGVPPAPCSGAVCDIVTVVSNIQCDDNGTPADLTDDTFTFDVTVTNADATFTNFSDDQGNSAIAYGSVLSYGPFPISGGTVTVNYTDDTDGTCTETADGVPPAPCSGCAADAGAWCPPGP